MALSGSSLLSVHLVSDVLIALASFAIPPALVALVRKRRDVPLPSLYLLFAAVFFAGGTTSLFDVLALWHPMPWLQGAGKAVTASLSVVTAILLWRTLPLLIRVPTPKDYDEVTRSLQAEIEERIRAERALRESEERFQAFMDNSPAVAFIKDDTGEFVYWNERAPLSAQLLGGRSWQGKTAFDLWPESACMASRHDQQVLQQSMPIVHHEPVLLEDGTRREWIVYKFPFTDRDGRRFIGGMAIDDTARAEAERALRSAHEELERRVRERTAELTAVNVELHRSKQELQWQAALLDMAPDPMFAWEVGKGIRYWNRRAEELYGFSRDVAEGRSSHDLLKTVLPLPVPALEETLRAQGHWKGELIQTTATGRCIVVESEMRVLSHPEPLIIEANRDITERKRAEDALRESQERYREREEMLRTLGDNLPDGLIYQYVLEPGGRHYFPYVSAGITRSTGLHAETLREDATPAFAQIVPEDLESLWQANLASAAQLTLFEAEVRRRLPTGEIRWFYYRSRPRRLPNGGTIWDGLELDITERKQAEIALRAALVQLQEKQEQLIQAGKLASLGELATGIAHEINNPLNNIALYVGNVLDKLAMDGFSREALMPELREALHQVNRAAEIITHLRAFARKAGHKRERVVIHDLIASVLHFMREPLRLLEVQVDVQEAPENPCIDGNRLQLEQVLVNLITNARDAVKEAPIKAISVATRIVNDAVELRIEDSGCGIPSDILPRIFDPFFTTKEVGHGTGLGLSISYGIIKDHGGNITVESVPGHGTVFIIRLPAEVVERRENVQC